MDVVAILAVRNEELYLEKCIRHLIREGIRVAVVDNDSTDRSLEICRKYHPEHVVAIVREPYTGYYDLAALLRAKERLARELGADWVIHHDADEIMHSYRGESLFDAILRIDRAGYSAINFNEFVFVPSDETRYEGRDYFKEMRHYYFFEPAKTRLIRAFKNLPGLSNVPWAGHRVDLGRVCVYPTNFVLRHYICLSRQHAVRKYSTRNYSPVNLEKGWHSNRAGKISADLALPDRRRLRRWHADAERLDTSEPRTTHFWQWSPPPPPPSAAVPEETPGAETSVRTFRTTMKA